MDLNKDEERVQTTTMYLANMATLWWRSAMLTFKVIKNIETWDAFKRELNKYFYAENVEFEAYQKLWRLKHDRSLREYVKEYLSSMLELPDMPERESLFGFLDSLQSWAAQ